MLTDERDPVRATMHPQRSFADVADDGQPRQTRRERLLRRMEALMP